MTGSSLAVDVHVAPMRRFAGAAAQAAGDEPVWSPMSSTLIAGDHDAVLVDTLITNDQVDTLADWVRGFGKRLTAVYITHGHADHWIGLARLQQHFPGLRGMATAEVVARAGFEASDPALSGYWRSIFPDELPDTWVLPDVLDNPTWDLEGHALQAVSVGQGDTEHSTVLHVPSVKAVIAGDVVYNRVHMMTAETDGPGRAAWCASLDAVAELEPRIVVAGHKRVGTADDPADIGATKAYLQDFTAVVDAHDTVEGIVAAMLALPPDRDNPRVLWHCARAALAKKT